MSYVKPAELVVAMADAGEAKIKMSVTDTLVKAAMGGAMLCIAAAFAVTVSVMTGSPLLGAILFPVGFSLLYLLGYDLLTGVLVLGPMAWLDRSRGITMRGVLRNWGLVFVGNFLGAFTVAVLMAIVVTYGFDTPPDEVGQAIGHIGEGRTVGYAEHGGAGMLTLFVRAMLCNWMVSTGVIGAMVAKDVVGKVLVMWMPIMLFFFMGFEHSIVNMFLFPSGLLLGGDFTIADYLIWNEIPTVLGNLAGGLVFTVAPLFLAYGRKRSTAAVTPPPKPRLQPALVSEGV
ncbi:formate/nitrite transporter family protein [Pseudactinotalea suaedae]|uniref:formate/nitrite transporter family protein n=1 Tax=Pseudactinotalea suaedae TaxID=1524924 RepID=UPI0012E2388D|nr:formate/nitrite transporter family protein [Pseudactinotalea suaedae]